MSEGPKDDEQPRGTATSIEKTTTHIKAGIVVAGGAVGALMTILSSHGIAIPIGFSAVPTVMFGLLSLLADDRGKRRLRKFAAGYESSGGSESPEVIAEDLCSKANDERGQDAVIESYRRAYEALDDAVVPYLGVLLHAYLHDALPLGLRFFRSFGRVLTELDRDELVALRVMLNGLLAEYKPTPHGFVDPSGKTSTDSSSVFVDETLPISIVQAGRGPGAVHHAYRLLLLLKNNELAVAPDVWGDDGAWSDEIRPDQFARLFKGQRNDAAIPIDHVVAMLSIIKDDIDATAEPPGGA